MSVGSFGKRMLGDGQPIGEARVGQALDGARERVDRELARSQHGTGRFEAQRSVAFEPGRSFSIAAWVAGGCLGLNGSRGDAGDPAW